MPSNVTPTDEAEKRVRKIVADAHEARKREMQHVLITEDVIALEALLAALDESRKDGDAMNNTTLTGVTR